MRRKKMRCKALDALGSEKTQEAGRIENGHGANFLYHPGGCPRCWYRQGPQPQQQAQREAAPMVPSVLGGRGVFTLFKERGPEGDKMVDYTVK